MRNEAWNEMDRIYTKKSSEKHFWTKFVERNYQIADRNYGICSLVHSDKKVQKLRTAILKCRTVIFGLAARIGSFKAVFSLELIDFDTPSSQTSLNWLEKRSKARKKRKNTIEERFEGELKKRARNHRSSWFIFSLLFYHVVLLFKHESLCNPWHDLWLDTLLGV
jgi:hypothetical protein